MDPHQTEVFTAVLIAVALIAVILIYFVLSLINHQRRNNRMQRGYFLAELSLLEREHTRVSTDLHDDLGPALTAIKFNIASLTVEEEDEFAHSRALELLDETVERIREIARDIMPAKLSAHGLESGLRSFVDTLQTPVTIRLEMNIDVPVEENKSLHVFRLLKEIIQNCLKHANAQNLFINISTSKGKLLIICEDDGRGFATDKTNSKKQGLGLNNMRSRTELLAGKLELYSLEGTGTQHKITIPL